MRPSEALRNVGWGLAVLALLFTGVAGVWNATQEYDDARTPLQGAVTLGVLLYGILGLAAGIGLLARRRWSLTPTIAWGVVVTFVATAAPPAYGGPDVPIFATVFGGFVALLIALGVILAAHAATRGRRA